MESINYNYLFNFVIVGTAKVGKTNFLNSYTNHSFTDDYISTIGIDFGIKTIPLGLFSVKMHIWDTAGQEKFKMIIKSYYKGAHGFFLVYDITDRRSFEELDQHYSEILSNSYLNPIILVIGNKSDLEESRQVNVEEGMAFAQKIGSKFIETSSKNGNNVETAFINLADAVCKKMQVNQKQVQEKKSENELESQVAIILQNTYENLFKVLLLGDEKVGKSSLRLCYFENNVLETYVPTKEVETFEKTFYFEGRDIKIQVWDTSGQDKGQNLSSYYYEKTNGIILIYDITNRESFENILNYMSYVEKYTEKNGIKLLIGNKYDLDSLRKVTFEEGEKLGKKYGMPFVETSAKNSKNIHKSVISLFKEIKRKDEISLDPREE